MSYRNRGVGAEATTTSSVSKMFAPTHVNKGTRPLLLMKETSMQHGYYLGSKVFFLFTVLFTILLFSSTEANAQRTTHLGVSPTAFVALTGAVEVGADAKLVPVGGNISQAFTVPVGKVLVLTDIIFSPKAIPASGDYLLQVTSVQPQGLATALSVTANATDASSLQVHLTGGMVFPSGSNVRVHNGFGSSGVDATAFGYLVKIGNTRQGEDAE